MESSASLLGTLLLDDVLHLAVAEKLAAGTTRQRQKQNSRQRLLTAEC
jgi:hypothetical protein